VQIGTDTTWEEIDAGWSFSLALKKDGSLWAWGNNTRGQLGTGDTENRFFPVQVESGTTWATMTAGGYHTLAIKTDGTLQAWGNNRYGQIGIGPSWQTVPIYISKLRVFPWQILMPALAHAGARPFPYVTLVPGVTHAALH
jgi:alpha-tubulin suppressor-like RCC1 family protein